MKTLSYKINMESEYGKSLSEFIDVRNSAIDEIQSSSRKYGFEEVELKQRGYIIGPIKMVKFKKDAQIPKCFRFFNQNRYYFLPTSKLAREIQDDFPIITTHVLFDYVGVQKRRHHSIHLCREFPFIYMQYSGTQHYKLPKSAVSEISNSEFRSVLG